ncbi:MAG: HD domain-containing protein [Gemmatimonadetes bacterium]|nr:HD domain-containing protein [Gemmatimonadota bacterium]
MGADVVADAAGGRLPPWAEATPARREHLARVAELLDRWAAALGLSDAERARWRAAAWLHDALRDADPAALRPLVPPECRGWPALLLHGPAAAARLRGDGCADEALLRAVAYHTIGHPELDELGGALYLADFLEPGRTFEPLWRAALRARMPAARSAVLQEVVGARIRHLVGSGRALRPETLGFWNSLARSPVDP